MVRMSVGCLGLAAFLALGSLQYAQAEPHEQPAFPVPRAEREFSTAHKISSTAMRALGSAANRVSSFVISSGLGFRARQAT